MGVFTIDGLASGLDTQNIIKQLMAIERRPLERLQSQKSDLQAKKDTWRDINTRLYNLYSRATDITLAANWAVKKADTSDANVLTVSAGSNAAAGAHTVSVSTLAKAHGVGSVTKTDPNAALGLTGSFSINGKSITVAASDSLNSIRDLINKTSGIGVTASVVQVSTGNYRMTITSTTTGAASKIKFRDGTTPTVTSANSAVVTATVTSAAYSGTYNVTVSQLATQAQSISSGTTITGSSTLTFALNGTTLGTQNVGATDTVDTLVTAINGNAALNTKLVASKDVSGKLLVKAKDTGANTLAITESGGISGLGTFTSTAGVDASYTIDGKAYTSTTNTDSTSIEGITFNLVGTSASAVAVTVSRSSGVLMDLGIINGTGGVVSELTPAQDATFTVDGLTVSRATNTVTDVLDGLTLTLKKEGTGASASVTVSQDLDKMVSTIKGFVDQYNSTIDFIKSKSSYDAKTKKADILFGDPSLNQLASDLRRDVTAMVPGLPNTLNSVSLVGITTGQFGTPDQDKLVLDETKLRDKLSTDLDGVARLFGAKLVNAALPANGGSVTASSTYLGDTVTYGADNVINGDSSATRWGSAGGGWQSGAVVSSASPESLTFNFTTAKTIDHLDLYTLTSVSGGPNNGVKDFRVVDVATGKELAKITGNTLDKVAVDFDAITTNSIRVEITGTNAADGYARVLEVEVDQKNYGAGSRVKDRAYGFTRSGTGIIAEKDKSYQSQLDKLDKSIAELDERLDVKEKSLRGQFERLETALGKLKNQSSWVSSQLQSLSTNYGR